MRVGVLVVMFVIASMTMRELGFTPAPLKHPLTAVRTVLRASIDYGLRNPPVRWIMLAAPFASGAGVYAFYALQPHLLELHGDPDAYVLAGVAAALVAATQFAGGWAAPRLRGLFRRRTSALLLCAAASASALVLLGFTASLALAMILVALWGVAFAIDTPIRRAYVNDMIPSHQRATVLSFDSLIGSTGGVVAQPALGRVADVHGYPLSFLLSGLFATLAMPFLVASRRTCSPSDDLAQNAATEHDEATE
jgi:MFS family permease